ncbi:MAG: cobalamin-dependent protein [Desulfobacterales bacterium]|jgi:methanogenic corrinoid protein MtbC1
MIDEKLYESYLTFLLDGKRSKCHDIVQKLLDDKIAIKKLYTDLFQRSMYRVGELWENNRITVANEHLATSITESLLNLAYPSIFAMERIGRKVVISCAANEFHQIGGKMVADIFELNGWDGYFLGANSPLEETARFIHETRPDVVGFSLSTLSNLDYLKRGIQAIRSDFPNRDLLIGGQAFRWGGIGTIKQCAGTEYIRSLNDLEKMISEM